MVNTRPSRRGGESHRNELKNVHARTNKTRTREWKKQNLRIRDFAIRTLQNEEKNHFFTKKFAYVRKT